jgi:HAD superfamily hydrolase (TIGR01509 family)
MDGQPVRAVVFDLGDTLWFEARRADPKVVAQMQADAVQPLLDGWDVRLDIDLPQLMRDIWSAYLTAWAVEDERRTLRDPSLPLIIRGAAASVGAELTDDQADAWWRAAWIPVRHLGVQLYPDTIDVLRAVRAMGLRIAVNTNRPCTSDMLLPDLEDFGLAPYVDVAVCSGDTGYVKPHTSTFELVLDRLGVAPDETVMVGDACDRDCGGARAVGMRTVWKLNGRYDAPACGDAEYAIHDLGELLALPPFDVKASVAATVESPTPHEDQNADRY